ncbi:GAF domain-containing protein [Deinococcus hopiensis]|uniref:GAF domain-containing protein n=1 Tax=Deinococcus hopiensis KR-140 TaxID=695939 RepID=A0A1W1UKK3_9DEIO|nr:GAF domain-containing protein [Deinococcus hopiensis]SMB81582.1 GAF domain-containing protein [Deinococcus hopiensis KR-140]
MTATTRFKAYAEEIRSHVAERLNAQKDYGISLDAITQFTAMEYEVPIALLTLIGKTHQYFKAAVGVTPEPVPVEVSFCRHTIQSNEVLVIPDTQLDPRFQDNPFVTGEPHLRFYAGAPILHEGLRVGSLCLLDTRPRTLTARQAENLAYRAYFAAGIFEYQQPTCTQPFRRLTFEQWRAARQNALS